jgi:hypothetical protein
VATQQRLAVDRIVRLDPGAGAKRRRVIVGRRRHHVVARRLRAALQQRLDGPVAPDAAA